MKHDMPILPVEPPMPETSVTVMEFRPVGRINPLPIADLYTNLGPDGAEDTICRVLEDIAERLTTLQKLRCRGDFDKIGQPANRTGAIARHIGLVEVEAAAAAVATSANQGDPVALQATLCRLERGFDAAISQIWDVQSGA